MIQPIMDQIQKKYRKFRNPVIPQSVIQYLYDEKDPNHVRPDIVPFRPYELDKDKDGTLGLRDNATGKFFYNLETTTIEERLSNGYYARPKDFVADIRSLAKDAKNIGDKERALKANELLANVEVDVASIESNPVMADCDNVYQRQLERFKAKEEKARKRAEDEAGLVGSDIPPADEHDAGPVILGEPQPKPRPGLFASYSTPPSLSNGTANSSLLSSHHPRLSNGSSIPSTRHSGGAGDGDDTTMSGTADSSQLPLDSQTMPPPPAVNTHQQQPSQQLSQRSAFQSIPHDVSLDALANDASTTTSGGKKTSSGSASTQLTNGRAAELSQFFSPPARARAEAEGGGDSQLADTQQSQSQSGGHSQNHSQSQSQSQEPWAHSQAHARYYAASSNASTSRPASSGPAFPSLHAGSDQELASTAGEPASPAAGPQAAMTQGTSGTSGSSQKDAIVDEAYLASLLQLFVGRTARCGVEQLEQVSREMMECLWRCRGEWNRSRVGAEVAAVFGEVVGDIGEVGGWGGGEE